MIFSDDPFLDAEKYSAEICEEQDRRDSFSEPLEILDRTADAVLAYKPKPKSKAAKRRARRKKRNQ